MGYDTEFNRIGRENNTTKNNNKNEEYIKAAMHNAVHEQWVFTTQFPRFM